MKITKIHFSYIYIGHQIIYTYKYNNKYTSAVMMK